MTTDTPALPRLGGRAPDFEADTTHGRLALGDFSGSWLVLFSHPADFTPVCTTEFMAFARVAEDLRARGCELLGLSIDGLNAHIAWQTWIEERMGVRIPFPIIADGDRRVATLYGMIMPEQTGTETSRCTFFIDPKGVVRAMIYYPLTTGRNVEEIVRVIDALRTTDAHGVATPADWRPGEDVLVPPPRTVEDAAARKADPSLDVTDWWFAKKKLPEPFPGD